VSNACNLSAGDLMVLGVIVLLLGVIYAWHKKGSGE
jgi:hypothetical protein